MIIFRLPLPGTINTKRGDKKGFYEFQLILLLASISELRPPVNIPDVTTVKCDYIKIRLYPLKRYELNNQT